MKHRGSPARSHPHRPSAVASGIGQALAPVESATDDAVRQFHRRFATGVTVVTTAVDGTPHGLVVNALSSVSLEPPLVLVCISQTSRTYPRLFDAELFAVNVLAHDQADVAALFARSGADKFAGVSWSAGRYGPPILDGVAAAVELEVVTRMPAYTHTIFVGRALATVVTDAPPLIYHHGQFFDGAHLEPAQTGGSKSRGHEQ